MDGRRRWAEALVMLGGGTLVVSFFLPLIRDWGPTDEHTASAAGFFRDRLGFLRFADSPGEVVRTLLAISFISAPYAFGTLIGWEAAAASFGAGGPKRLFRVGVRCCLCFWLAGSLLLPMLSGNDLEPEFRTLCQVIAGLLLVVWLVLGRWWPPRGHVAFMRRGRLLGAILSGLWFGLTLTLPGDFFTATVIVTLAGVALIAAGSLPGLFTRAESA